MPAPAMGASRHSLRFSGTLAAFAGATRTLEAILEAHVLQAGVRHNVLLAFEEIGANIVRHASSTADVTVTVVFADDEVALTFEDDGVPFDPTCQTEPKEFSSLADATIGGLGITLIRRFSSRMNYERTADHRNRLTVSIAARAI